MKIKSIAAICKKNKNIAIFERYSDDGDILTQYIGDGSAVYPVVGLPQLDKESLLTIFDVPEKDRDNYFVKTLGVPAGISFEDTDETERHVEREGISIIYSGRTLKPIRTTRGLVFIESRYLSPVADVLDVLDPAATDKTAKCSLYYTPETDGLSQSWDRGGAVFCNPPYGREIGKWVQKAFEEARGGIRLFYLSQRGQTRHIFTITFTGKRKSASCAGGYGSRTTTETPPIPRPSRQW